MSSSSDEDTPLAAMKPILKKRKATAEGAASGAGVKAAANGGSSSGDRKAKAPKSYKEDNSDDDDDAFEEPKLKKKVKSSGGGGSSTKEDKESGKKRKIVVKKSPAEESDDDEDDDDDDFEDTKVKKKAKAKPAPSADAKKRASGSSKAKAKPAASAASNGRKKQAKAAAAPAKKRASGAANGARKPAAKVKAERPAGKFKDSTQLERLDHAMKAYKWWEEPPLAPGRQWSHLEHNGMSFPDEYEPHGVPLMYDGEEMELSPEDEEIATFFADVPLDGPQLGDAATAKVFSANFFSDWKESMPTGHPLKNAKFDKCDFGAMRAHLQQRRLIKKAATDGERAAAKAEKERRFHLFGLAIVDGHLEKVGNFIMEPPGLFRGRGKHPKTGKLKKRAYPSEVTVNIGEEAKVPQCPVPGFAWGNVQHDPGVAWLSTWKENINNMNKYAMLSASSSFKGKSDMEKYNKAMRLKGHIDAIRRNYERGLNASTSEMRQLATAMWLIDKLALRVGGEKGEDEADTVGCCTLRVEHMTFGPAGTREMELEFLGKDSMLFKQNIDFTAYGDIGSKVFDNLTAFCKGRKPAEQVFQKIDPTTLNKHLQSLMPGLSAKVFRTYNASETLQQQLPSADALKNMTVQAKVVEYNNANREVAILCNHQRTVSGAMLKSFENLGERVAKVKEQRADLKAWLKLAKDGKAKKIPLKGRGSSQDADDDEEKVKAAIQKAKDAKANATTSEEKVAATKLAEAAATAKKELTQRKFEGSHMFANTPSEEQLQRKIEGWTTKLKKMEVDLRDKEQNKEVSLGTSKINYMDPRISVAWCKRNEVPIERIFAKTLRDKFVWAMNVPPDWRFDFETLRAVTAESSDEPKAVTAVADDADAKAKGKGDDDEEEEEEEEEEMD